MQKVPEEYKTELADEISEKSVISARVGCLLIIFLYPIFGVLDWVLYPDIAWDLIQVRLVVTILEIVLLVLLDRLTATGKAKHWIRPISWAIIYPAALGLDYIILLAGGAESPYYAGLNLLLLGVMAALPWPPREMGKHILLIWAQYFLMMVALGPDLSNWRVFLGNNYFLISTIVIGMGMSFIGYELRVQEFLARRQVALEKERSDALLLNILPEQVANELKANGRVEARLCPSASILFTDFVGFTSIADQTAPADLVASLHFLFVRFDEIITRHGLEKLKTIGDSYMCVGGVPVQHPDHLIACVLAALEIQDFLANHRDTLPGGAGRWQARVGIHTGPVIAGVIGNRKFAFDVWGDTVNLASRLEAASEAGQINVATDTFKALKPLFVGQDRGYLPVKGKGPVAMTFVRRIRPEFSADERGLFANDLFWEAVRAGHSRTATEPPRLESPRPADMTHRRSQPMQPDLWKQLSGLTDKDRQRLGELAESFHFEVGEEIVTQGQRLDALLIVVAGHVSVRLDQDDTKIDVSVLGPGDLFGEMSFVTGELTSASVVGVDSGEVARLARADLTQVMEQDVGFAARLNQALAVLLANRLRETTTRLPALIVDEVAHTRLHHATITGRVAIDAVPPSVIEGVERFKQGMWQVDRDIMRAGASDEGHYDRAANLTDDLKRVLANGVAEVRELGEAAQDGVGSYVFREAFPYFMLSRMIDRSFSKPRGYAGDYYTIELIQLNEPSGDSRLGPLIDRHYLDSLPSRAVRNRRRFMTEALHTRWNAVAADRAPFAVTSLAAGAGRELFDFMGNIPPDSPVSATFIDIDPQALTYGSHLAQESGIRNQVMFAKENVIHLALGKGRTRLPPQDVIYSMGLLDYLKDKVVVRLLNWIHATLKPGGLVIVGNFAHDNPEKDFMDHILDWRLYHRSPDDMRRLFAASDFGDQPVDVRVEAAGVNLMVFCERRS